MFKKLSSLVVVFMNSDVCLVCRHMLTCRTYPLVRWHEVFMYVYLFIFFSSDMPVHNNSLPVPRKSRPALTISTVRAVSGDVTSILLLH
jgi:hypothetical protein